MEFNIETYLNSLPENTVLIDVKNRNLTYLPSLARFTKLRWLWCCNNQLTSLPHLNEEIKALHFNDNPISEIIKGHYMVDIITPGRNASVSSGENLSVVKKQIQLLNNFRHLYYSLKFKNKFRHLLWSKVMEPKAMKKYHPNYLLEHLGETMDLDEFLDKW